MRCFGITRFLCPLFALAIGACHDPATAISDQIDRRAHAGGTEPVRLADAAPSAWDSVRIVGPYAGPTSAADSASVMWRAASGTHIGRRDDIDVLLFFRGGAVSEVVEHPRAQGDFDSSAFGRSFRRADAVFRAQPRNGGVTLIPASGAPR